MREGLKTQEGGWRKKSQVPETWCLLSPWARGSLVVGTGSAVVAGIHLG